ncbi:nuclear transport factor 2 family protein [Nonomuraea cavernae]|nr:nuclear transport factor 2 family protein [Nonomuraea cavernae]MCA2187931.1 nuclear transport factor 2 family protein [Nonomuraea cavernae]
MSGGTGAAVAVVEDFLAALGRGDRDAAARHLADGAVMIFPGGRRHTTLDELAAASAIRYRHVDKHREEYEAFTDEAGDVVVWSMGTLFGENNAGVRYDGVRYVDRFRLRDGKIVEQRVWNDLAQSGVLDARAETEIEPQWRARASGGEPAPPS